LPHFATRPIWQWANGALAIERVVAAQRCCPEHQSERLLVGWWPPPKEMAAELHARNMGTRAQAPSYTCIREIWHGMNDRNVIRRST
jgi:hypothetical protein